LEFPASSLALEGVPNLAIRTSRICQTQRPGYLLQPGQFIDAIDVFGMVPFKDVTPSDIRAIP